MNKIAGFNLFRKYTSPDYKSESVMKIQYRFLKNYCNLHPILLFLYLGSDKTGWWNNQNLNIDE
ncbi:MAG TPA: hypothetical protein DER09_13130 [Prolixibacteraceae bacterium]|nr:hypothetical protein [Prolixibacteraceae bacterium]